MPKKKRNYKREYELYHGKPEQIKRRSSRNKARRKMGNPKGEVEHKDGNPNNNSRKNLTVKSAKFQRRQGGAKGHKGKGRKKK